jgi:hypothetical protein
MTFLAACTGENRPKVDVLNSGGSSGSVSVSVSASGPAPTTTSGSSQIASGNRYQTVSNVDIYFLQTLDMRDMQQALAPAAQSQPVDWAAVTAIYEQGKNAVRPDGTVRSLQSLAVDPAVLAVFPNGASVYGSAAFLDARIKEGLTGTGRAQGLSDNARRQIVEKGVQTVLYGKAMQEMNAARTRVEQRNTDNNTGAPHAVDEAWALVAGAPDFNANRPWGLLQVALNREPNFSLQGKVRDPLERAFVSSLAAAQTGDLAAFDQAYGEVSGYLNTIYYLGTLRYGRSTETATSDAARQVTLAEGWTFFQTIRATVAAASPTAAQTVEGIYRSSPSEAFPASKTSSLYKALNEPAVLQALGIPSSLVVRTPPQ